MFNDFPPNAMSRVVFTVRSCWLLKNSTKRFMIKACLLQITNPREDWLEVRSTLPIISWMKIHLTRTPTLPLSILNNIRSGNDLIEKCRRHQQICPFQNWVSNVTAFSEEIKPFSRLEELYTSHESSLPLLSTARQIKPHKSQQWERFWVTKGIRLCQMDNQYQVILM